MAKYDPYREKLEELINEGEALLTQNLNREQHAKLENELNDLKLKFFQSKIKEL